MPPSSTTTHERPSADVELESAASDTGPDDVFAVVAGLYLGLVVAPLATVLLSRFSDNGAVLYSGLFGGVFVLTVVGAVLVRRFSVPPERLGATRKRWAPAIVSPVVAGVCLTALVVTDSYANLDGALGVAAGVGGFTAGSILGIMARTRYTGAVVARAEHVTTWRTRWPEEHRKTTKVLSVIAILCGGVAFVVGVVIDYWLLRSVGHLLIPVGAATATFGQSREYSASAAGIEVRRPAARGIARWDAFDGYVVTDEAILVHRQAPWRFPLIFDRSALDDEDAVLETLSDHLPRLPAR